MMAQFKQHLSNRSFALQDHGKDDPIDTLENRIIFRLKIINIDRGPVPDNLYD